MSDLIRVSDIAKRTGLSARHWQRLISAGKAPWARYVDFGKRRTYLVDSEAFGAWWASQLKEVSPCPGISIKSAGSGTRALRKTAAPSGARSKQSGLQSLKNDLRSSVAK